MNSGCSTFDQLQTRYQFIRLIKVDGSHIVAVRIQMPDVVFGNLNCVLDQRPEDWHLLNQLSSKIGADGLHSELSASSLSTILISTLKYRRMRYEAIGTWKIPLTKSSTSRQSSRDISLNAGRPGPRAIAPLLLPDISLSLNCSDNVRTP